MEIKIPQLPFLTREMIKFGNKSILELEVVSYATTTSKILMVGLTRDGVIKFDLTHAGDGAAEVEAYRINDVPISLTLFTDSVTVERGEYYASVYLKIDGERVYKLCSGYITKQSGISYPNTHDENELGGRSHDVVSTGSNPAAGAEHSETVPTNQYWKIKYVTTTLVTSAAVANRRVHLKFELAGGGYPPIDCFCDVDQPASTTYKYHFAPWGTLPSRFDDNDVLVPIPPDLIMHSGGDITTETTNLQAGDNFGEIYITRELYLED